MSSAHKLTLLMAQFNPTVGAIETNTQKIIEIISANLHQHDLIIFPELAITGYSIEDLLFRPELLTRVQLALESIMAACVGNCYVIIGHPDKIDGKYYNTASVFSAGKCVTKYYKQNLPQYGVFDEARYFTQGPAKPCVFTLFSSYRIGLCICEDIWQEGPVEQLLALKVDLIIVINSSPFDDNKYARREKILQKYSQKGVNIIYVNQIGGQDDLIFDGQSMAWNAQGILVARAPAFIQDLQTITITNNIVTGVITPLLSPTALIYQALVAALRDYVEKNHFPGVLIGLSGGIDSALVLAIAVDALGPERVHTVMMPSRFTSAISLEDACTQAETMQVQHSSISIEPMFTAALLSLQPAFSGLTTDTTEENIQARIRGLLLMALSNKSGFMVVTTANKSEMAVGYSTLYGDMCGGFAVLKDVLKTTVYALANYRNQISAVIPTRVITRPPSAELALNQVDSNNLPEYAILDAIITDYMDNNLDYTELIQKGFQEEIVLQVIRLIKRNEYKRRQSPPGPKITTCAFGKDWRYPITSHF